jgi:MFS family permease
MTAESIGRSSTDLWSPRMKALLAVLCAALFLDSMDVSLVGVALPSLKADLGLSTTTLQWVVSAYVLGYGGFLLLGGRAADLFGRRAVFLASLGLFIVATVMGGLVSTGLLVIIARFVKGFSAAFTAPAGMSIITTTFAEGPARNRALSIYTGCAADGFSLGLVLSGLLTEWSWRATFLFPAPLALIALVGGLILVPRSARVRRPGEGFDVAGAVLVTGSLLLLVYTLTQAPAVGWGSARTVLSFILCVVLLAVFVVVEQRVASPLVRLGILRNRSVLAGNLAGFIYQGAYMGYQFILVLYLQRLLGWSALETAFAVLPAGCLVVLLVPRMGAVIGRFGPARVLVAGFCILVLAYANILRIDAHSSYPFVILPTVLLIGLSFVTSFPCINILATSRTAQNEQGLAAGLINASIQIGAAVCLAVVTAVVTANTGPDSGAASQLAGYRPGLAAVLGIAVLGLGIVVISAVLAGRRATVAPEGPAASDTAQPADLVGAEAEEVR